jgi:hypothetical protein
MKRFLLFIYPEYYPSGGMFDYHSSYDTLEEAYKVAKKCGSYDLWNILDIQTGDVWDDKHATLVEGRINAT